MRADLQRNERRWCGQMSALLLTFSLILPFAQLAFVPQNEADVFLPACCRIHGQHKCAMHAFIHRSPNSSRESSPQFARVSEKCPYSLSLTPAAHRSSLCDPGTGSAELRIREERTPLDSHSPAPSRPSAGANYKRGPPASSQSA